MIGFIAVLGLAGLGSWTIYSSLRSRRDTSWRRRHESLLEGSGFYGGPDFAAPALRWMWLLGAGLMLHAVFLAVWLTVQTSSFTASAAFAQGILAGFLFGCGLVVVWVIVQAQGRRRRLERSTEDVGNFRPADASTGGGMQQFLVTPDLSGTGPWSGRLAGT